MVACPAARGAVGRSLGPEAGWAGAGRGQLSAAAEDVSQD